MSASTSGPLVSVVIPNYNYGRFLGGAIESVLQQSYPRVEIVVVDDGSSDESETVLHRYDGKVRWFRHQRLGVSVARNRGVQESHGELVAFLDADDTWLLHKLERQVARWLQDPSLGLIHCASSLIDEHGMVVQQRLDGSEGRLTNEMLLFRSTTVPFAGSTALIPREVVDAVGGFDHRLSTSADWDFCYRVASRYLIGFVPEPLANIRLHRTNMHRNIHLMEHDMLLAYAKAFREAPAGIRRIRRRSYGNLHMSLGGSFFRAGQWSDAMRHIATSLVLTPGNWTLVAEFPWRWWRRRVQGRRLNGVLAS